MLGITKRRLLSALIGLSLLGSAHAFKLETHLWVGQQVINDLADDGKISFKLNGKQVNLDVPADVRAAILANKNEYLLGHLGPDVAPDVVVGQTIVHPGLPNAWKSNDWLQFLLDNSRSNPLGKSYSYGYLGHAAGDMFAHTYVNQYAGDIFDLRDETLVEQRHIALEGFIAKFTPPLQDHTGKAIGQISEALKPSNGYGTFVRDTLVMNDVVQQQYGMSATGKHLWAYYQLRKVVDKAAQNPAWEKIDAQVLRLFASHWGVNVSTQNAQSIVAKANEIIPKIQRGEDNVQALANDINNLAQRLDNKVFNELKNTTQNVLDLNAQVAQAHIDILSKEKEIRNTLPCPSKFFDPVGHFACKKSNELIDRANDAIRQALTGLNSGLKKKQDQLLAAAVGLRDAAKKTEQLIVIVTNAQIDFGQRMGQNTSPIKSALLGWRGDIDVAMREYVKATTQSMLNTTNHADAMVPLRTWFDCYHMSIMGLPHELSSCEIRDAAKDAYWATDRVVKLVDDLNFAGDLLGLPSPSDVRAWRDGLVQQAKDQVQAYVAKRAEEMLPADIQDLITLLHRDMDDATLNAIFTKPDSSGKRLLMIPDMAARARAEMSLVNGTYFDPQKYAAAYNSVVLSKLALLDKAGLMQLAQMAQAANGSDGKPVFTNTDNVLAGAIANMDGNHQWMPNPPARPNAQGAPYAQPPSYASPAGFVPWNGTVRNSLFRSLFIGPISPGLENASEIAMSPLVKADYPYRPCAARPFPDDQNDQTCAGGGSAVSLKVRRDPQVLIAGQSYSVSWTSNNASKVSYSCSANAGGFAGNAQLETVNGSVTGVAQAGWVGNPSNCTWTATAANGSSVNVADNFSTQPANTAVVASVSPNSVQQNLSAPGAGSASVNVQVAGGSGNYSYSWSHVTGNRITVNGGQNASFNVILNSGESVSEILRVTVQDSQGHIASADVNVSFSAPAALPSLDVKLAPATLLVGQNYSLSWNTSNATSLSYNCTANGTGFAGGGSLTPIASGSVSALVQAAWVGYPSQCVVTATGPGGSQSQNVTLNAVGAAPVVSFNPQNLYATFRGTNNYFRGVASKSVTPVISGGNPPFTLQWQQLSGDAGFTVENNGNGSATFKRQLNAEEVAGATYQVTVTDIAGRSSTANLNLSFESTCGGTH